MNLSADFASLAAEATYVAMIVLMMAGLFILTSRDNLVKKLVGLGIFQSSVYLLYVAPGKLLGGTAPILDPRFSVYSNPLPHVLILTAIVVGVATLALGLALAARIRERYGSIDEDDIVAADNAEDARAERAREFREDRRGTA